MPGSACIVPIQHRRNLLECDDDEWEEIRVSLYLSLSYHACSAWISASVPHSASIFRDMAPARTTFPPS